MIKQIGHEGLIFFTFSAADLHWPELHKLINEDSYSGNETDSGKQQQNNIINNPLIATWLFNKRFEIFFNEVLVKRCKLEDYWYRFEWQHRGSVHVHGIGKKKNAPTIDWNTLKENEERKKVVVQYLDSIVSTINPQINAVIPEKHPCQKVRDEIKDDTQDYVELINKVQRHTRCSPSYCIRVNKENNKYADSDFPKRSLIIPSYKRTITDNPNSFQQETTHISMHITDSNYRDGEPTSTLNQFLVYTQLFNTYPNMRASLNQSPQHFQKYSIK